MDSLPAKLTPWQPIQVVGRQNSLGGVWAVPIDKSHASWDQPASIGWQLQSKAKKSYLYNFSFPNINLGADSLSFQYLKNSIHSNTVNKSGFGFFDTLTNEKSSYLSAAIMPSFEIGRFQMSYVQKNHFISYTNDKITSIDFRREWGPVLGLSLPLIPGQLNFGVAYKYLTRKVYYGNIENNFKKYKKASEHIKESLEANKGWGLNAGILYTPPIIWSPVFSLAVRDVGGTVYRASSGFGSMETERSNWALAARFSPDLLKGQMFGMNFMSQTQGVNDQRLKPKDRWGFGVEAYLGGDQQSPLMSLRSGHNMRSWSAGITLDLFLFRLDLDTFGATDSRSAHRRTAGRVTVDLKG